MLNPIEEIKNRLDIVDVIGSYLKLKKAGANMTAVCPFHSEKKPSFFVSPSKQIWKCFGCGAGGGIFDFIMQIEGVEFGDALRILAKKAGVELKRERPEIKTKRQRLYEVNELAARFYEKQLEASSIGKEAKQYLLNRKISEQSIKLWRLGYSPDKWRGLSDFLISKGYAQDEIVSAGLAIRGDGGKFYDRFRARIMFPIFDFNSQIIGFGGRIFKQEKEENQAKYLNTPNTLLYDKSYTLYGLNNAKVEIRKQDGAVLVEGYTDVILSHQHDVKNVVAVSGTALTLRQLNILKRYSNNLLLSFDMDIAGDMATKRGIGLAQEKGFNIKILTLTGSHDAADVISRDPEEWKKIIANAKEILEFYFETTLAKFDQALPQDKERISQILLPVIKRIPNNIVRFHWIQKLAQELGVREKDIEEELLKVQLPKQEEEKQENSFQLLSKTRQEVLEKELLLLILADKENINFLDDKDYDFFSSETKQILLIIKKYGLDFELLKKELSPIRFEQIQTVSLEGEIGGKIEQAEEEIRKCLDIIIFTQKKKDSARISQEIRQAEQNKDFVKVEALKKEFYEVYEVPVSESRIQEAEKKLKK